MPVGMEILNTSGSILINQDFKVLQLVSKIPHTSMTASSLVTFGRWKWETTVPYTDAIFAVSNVAGNTNPLIVQNLVVSGGNTTVSVASVNNLAQFDLFVFRAAGGGTTSSGAGVEVFNADGSLGFGSAYKPFRVLSQFEWRYDNSGDGSYFTPDDYAAYWSGKRVACVFSKHARALDGEGTLVNMNTPVFTTHFRNVQSTGEGRLSWQVTSNAGKDVFYWERKGRFMFIDVTNY